MARYQHFVRKTTDAPALTPCSVSVCFNGYYRINLVNHGFTLGQVLLFSGFGLNFPINGTHTVTNENLAANAFNIDVGCVGSPNIDNGFVQVPDDATYRQVYPLGFSKANFQYEQPEGQIFFVKKLVGKLTFINQPSSSITDFSYFYNSELDSAGLVIDACIGYQYIIKQECNGVFEDYYEAKFSLHNGDWDLDNCTFSIEPAPNTNYDCVLNDIKVNILDSTPAITTLFEAGSNPDRNYTNSRKLSVVLEYLITQTCGIIDGITSDFFQINPENTSTYNYVTFEVNPYTELTIAAVKDVEEPIPSTLQDNVTVSFIEFMNELHALFNVYFIIENNFIRIEHVSYFAALSGMDLTQAKYDKYDTDKNKYTYLEVPRTDSLIASGTNYLQVLYDNECSIEKRGDEKISSTFITTLAIILRLSPNRFKGSKDGIVLFATEYDSGLGKYVVLGSENNELWPSTLFVKFFRHNLSQSVGSLITSQSTIYDSYLIYSSKKNKLQTQINIPLCCDDAFNPEDKILTALGYGLIDSAAFTVKDDTLKLNLKYGADDVSDITSLSQVSCLDLWLDAAAGVTQSGGQVSAWADQSGNGRNAVQATGAKQPSITTVDGVTVIAFDGVDDGMSTPSFQTFPNKRGHVFIVFKCTIPTGAANRIDHLVGTYGTGAGTMWQIDTVEDYGQLLKHIGFDGINSLLNVNIPQSASTAGVTYGYDGFILLSANRISDTVIEGVGNGSLGGIGSPISQLAIANTQPNSNPVNIGNSFIAGNSEPFYGCIAEIAIYNDSLSDYERQQVEQYFFKKYSLIKQYT